MKIIALLCLLAVPAFSAPTETRSAATTALLAKGDALCDQLKSAEALAVFQEAEKATPNDAEVLRRLAKANAEMMVDTPSKPRRKELGLKAVDYAERAVAAEPNNALAHLALAICYGRVASFLDNQTKIDYSKRIQEHARKSVSLDPSNDYAYHVLGAWNYELAGLSSVLRVIAKMIYGGLPDASYDEAVRNFTKAIALAPQRVAHHIELGRTYAAMGDAKLARAELTQGLALPSREKDDPETKERGRAALANLAR